MWRIRNGGDSDFTHFPADLIKHEALTRGGFAMF